jgi:hypothetical protein
MVDNFSIPHKSHAPDPKSTKVEAAVRQAVQESLGTAFPSLYRIQGNLVLNITVNIHLHS